MGDAVCSSGLEMMHHEKGLDNVHVGWKGKYRMAGEIAASACRLERVRDSRPEGTTNRSKDLIQNV